MSTAPFDSDITRLLRAGPDFARYAAAYFEDGLNITRRALPMAFSDGAGILMIKMRGQQDRPLANEALVLALFAELQAVAAKVPA